MYRMSLLKSILQGHYTGNFTELYNLSLHHDTSIMIIQYTRQGYSYCESEVEEWFSIFFPFLEVYKNCMLHARYLEKSCPKINAIDNKTGCIKSNS